MPEEIRERLSALADRAGLHGLSPSAVRWLAIVCAAIVAFAVWRWRGGSDVGAQFGFDSAAGSEQTSTAPALASTATAGQQVVVHVVGAVRRPGVYTLVDKSRVADAVEAAGGFLGSAAPEGVNLARILADGEQLVVPTKDELAKGLAGNGAAGASSHGPPSAAGASGGRVNLNSATESDLDALPGVGPSTAAKIVQDRESNGPFSKAEDLMRVPGIGPKKFDSLKDLVTVG